MVVLPSRTIPQAASRVFRRQTTTVPVTAQPTDVAIILSPGGIAGIVLCCIAGMVLLWWIVKSCVNQPTSKAPPPSRHYHMEEARPSRSRSRRRSGSADVHVRAPTRVYTGGRSPARVYATDMLYEYDYDNRRRSSRY